MSMAAAGVAASIAAVVVWLRYTRTGWRVWAFSPLMALLLASALTACGGGDSSVTTITGAGLNSLGQSPPAVLSRAFVQSVNNLKVTVEEGPTSGFTLTPNANILYATVTVCLPGNANVPGACQTIDHVQVDTGSVGLRVLASKVRALNLPAVPLTSTDNAWECYPFVIGGLWGSNAVADVVLGQQVASSIPIQLIQDDSTAAVQAPVDCITATDNTILSSAAALGSNGILGIGDVALDCGLTCQSGDYTGGFVQYYSCPVTASNSGACSGTAVQANQQTYNPVAAFTSDVQGNISTDNNGVILSLPAVGGVGAATATGELVFGINTRTNNQMNSNLTKVYLGTQWAANPASYLNVTTAYKGTTYYQSYLDTGTNGLFFTDNSSTPIPFCLGGTWYCPPSTLALSAVLSDGDAPSQNRTTVNFDVGNADAMFSTKNSAFGTLAGAPPQNGGSFSWGLPFFYGKKVYLSIWQQAGAINGPWYAWTLL
jgi:hypothetical protein